MFRKFSHKLLVLGQRIRHTKRMKRVYMIHGFEGAPNGGWLPWLMRELEKEDVYACALPMPHPSTPKLTEWLGCLNNLIENPDENTFLIGHSLGVPTITQYVATLPEGKKIGGLVLVAGPIKNTTRSYGPLMETFFTEIDFEKIKQKVKKIFIIHGEDDQVVSVEEAKEYQQQIGGELVILKSGGHFSGDNGVFELPEVLNALKKMF